MKTIATAQADFRGNDRDGNGVQDFWRGDIAGLYYLVAPGTVESIKLIEVSMAEADLAPLPEHRNGSSPSPRGAYVFVALHHPNDADGPPSPNHFAAGAFPTSYDPKGWPRYSFVISENNTVFKKDLGPGGRVLYYPSDVRAEGWTPLH